MLDYIINYFYFGRTLILSTFTLPFPPFVQVTDLFTKAYSI